MEISAFIFGLVGGLFGLTFSVMSLWAKSYNLWPVAVVVSIAAIILSFLMKNKVKNASIYMIVLAILGWIFVSKIFYIPAIILIFSGFLGFIFERESKEK